MLTLRGLPRDSTCVLTAKPGKLDIKRREPGSLFISLPIVPLFKLPIMMYFFIFVLIQRDYLRHFQCATSQCPDNGSCREKDNVYQATCSNAVN